MIHCLKQLHCQLGWPQRLVTSYVSVSDVGYPVGGIWLTVAQPRLTDLILSFSGATTWGWWVSVTEHYLLVAEPHHEALRLMATQGFGDNLVVTVYSLTGRPRFVIWIALPHDAKVRWSWSKVRRSNTSQNHKESRIYTYNWLNRFSLLFFLRLHFMVKWALFSLPPPPHPTFS